MKKHYVTFYSPGTLVAEQTTKEIDSWDTDKAIEMAKGIQERHGAIPYGFIFTTRERSEADFDSKQTEHSGMYYLGGKVFTLEDIKARNNPDDHILISNMQNNGYDRVVENNNSWRWTQPLNESDVVLNI